MSTSLKALSDEFGNRKRRIKSVSDQPSVLTDIYREETNIVIWQRSLSPSLQASVDRFLSANIQVNMTVTPQSALSGFNESLIHAESATEISENIAELVDMFCYLFDLREVGVRLTSLNRAMCPRFHVDRVPCRLVTTYFGSGTEWLPHHAVDRTKLGAGNQGLPDDQSGLFQGVGNIQKLNTGDVALLKGESWQNNENAGLVHRSPEIKSSASRLLLTIDFLS